MQAWQGSERLLTSDVEPPNVDEFRPHGRDQYVAGGDVGVWQAAVRDAADSLHGGLSAAIRERRPFTVMLLYTDQVGEQRTISRFGLSPAEDGGWVATVARHYYLDSVAPR